ncbi:MAG: hypothetical protein SGJ11_10240 [Phycisphaerae bacterium]|nr:hypothetical protein [Phycisphaerae bacterium]
MAAIGDESELIRWFAILPHLRLTDHHLGTQEEINVLRRSRNRPKRDGQERLCSSRLQALLLDVETEAASEQQARVAAKRNIEIEIKRAIA